MKLELDFEVVVYEISPLDLPEVKRYIKRKKRTQNVKATYFMSHMIKLPLNQCVYQDKKYREENGK